MLYYTILYYTIHTILYYTIHRTKLQQLFSLGVRAYCWIVSRPRVLPRGSRRGQRLEPVRTVCCIGLTITIIIIMFIMIIIIIIIIIITVLMRRYHAITIRIFRGPDSPGSSVGTSA